MKVNKTSKTAAFLLLTLIAFSFSSFTPSSKAQNGVVLVRMEPATLTVDEGKLFNITIYIENIPEDPGVVGVEFKVYWDPSVLKAASMEEVMYHTVTPEPEWDNIWKLKHEVADDHVWYAYTWMNMSRAVEGGYAPISGNHTVAIITLNATATGLTALEFLMLKIGSYDAGVIIIVDYPEKPLPENFSLIQSTITVGNPPPLITVISPQNMTYNKIPVNLTFTISEPTDWIGYSLDGQANVTINGNITLSPSDGAHSMIVYANDTTGNMGASDRVCFTVDTTPPVALFSYYPEEPEAELIFGTYKWKLTFNASESSDSVTEIIKYEWDFGDGTTETGMIVNHMYREPGTYDVTLNVTDAVGHSTTYVLTITIPEPPAEPLPLSTIIFITVAVLIPVVYIIGLMMYIRKSKKRA